MSLLLLFSAPEQKENTGVLGANPENITLALYIIRYSHPTPSYFSVNPNAFIIHDNDISVNPDAINHRRDKRQTKNKTAVRQWAGSFQVVPTRPVNPALYK